MNFKEILFTVGTLLCLITNAQAVNFSNLNAGQLNALGICSTNWNINGTTYRCINSGRITFMAGVAYTANTDIQIIANNGFSLNGNSIGTSSQRINLQSDWGTTTTTGANSVFGNITSNSGAVTLAGMVVNGNISTGGQVNLSNVSIAGSVTSNNNAVTTSNATITGNVTATNGAITVTGGNIGGDIFTNCCVIQLTNLTFTGSSIQTNSNSIILNGGDYGSPTNAVTVQAANTITLNNNVNIYGGVIAATGYASISANDNSMVYGSCSSGNTPSQLLQFCSTICENFDNGVTGWTYQGSGTVGVSSQTFNSAPNSLYLRGLPVTTISPQYNTSTLEDLYLNVWIRRGADSFSNYPETNENLVIEYQASNNNWVELETFLGGGTSGEEFDRQYSLPSNANHNDLRFRFRKTNGNNGNFDYWHVDDVCLSSAISIPAPIQEYRFDESTWNGTAGEVFDYSTNALHGTANGSSIEDNGAVCRAGDFTNNGYVTVPNLNALRTTSTLSFWVKTPNGYAGNDTSWQAPALAGIEESGGANDIFWGWIDANGRIGMTKGNTNNGRSVSSINNGLFNHVVLSWNHVNGNVQVYVNGSLETNSTTESGAVSNTFNTIGRVNYTNNSTPNYLNAELDEILVFDEILSAAQVRQIYDLQRTNKNLDGSDRTCSAPLPTQCFSDNFNRSDLGSDWAITTRGTTDYDPQIANNRLRITPAQGNVATAATLFRLFPSAGNRVIVEFDHYAYDGGSNGGDGIAIVFSDSEITPQPGGYGGSLGYAQKDSISGFAGGWLGIGIDEYGNFINRNDGDKDGGFTDRRRETVSIRGSGSGTSGYRYIIANGLPIGDTSTLPASLNPPVQNSSGHRYRITIDNSNNNQAWVSLERDTGSGFIVLIPSFDILAQTGQAAVPEKLFLTITGSTGGATNNHEIGDFEVCADVIEPVNSIDHYQLERDFQQGLTCEALNISSRACLNADCSTLVNGLISTTFLPVTGWQGGNVKTDYEMNASPANNQFLFQQTVPGTYTLGVSASTPNIRPLATEPVQCFVGAAKQADCDVEFVDAAYRFFANSAPTTAVTAYSMTAGQLLDNLLLRAITTDPATGQCTTLLNPTPVDSQIGTECFNPNTCLVGEQVTWQQGIDYVLANPENQVDGSNTSTVPIGFNNAGTATFAINAPDIGLQTLTVSTPIPDVDGNSSGESITGSVNLQVSPASLELYNVLNNSNQTPSSNAFAKAGETFTAQLRARDINNNEVASSERVLDSQTINWATSTLNAPAGGVLGNIGSSGDASSGYNLTYSEVGSINLRARIDNFLGFDSVLTSDNITTGRFTPAYFTVTQNGLASWGSTLNAYQGRAEALNNLALTLQARDINGDVLQNYSGSLVSFTLPSNPIEKADLLATGGALASNGTWALSNHTDFDGSLTLTANIANLNWQRNPTSVTSNDTPQTINQFNFSAAALTDADGICVKANDAGMCLTSEFDITQRTLFFARADLPSQVQATGTSAFIPIAIETLDSFDDGLPIFALQTTESSLGRTIIEGLNYTPGDVCTISADCTTIANSADNTLTSLTATGTTVLNGQGMLTVTSASELNGMLQATLQAPNWLSWDWDNDNTTAMTLDKTLILFGGYQGRPPVLFTTPGVR